MVGSFLLLPLDFPSVFIDVLLTTHIQATPAWGTRSDCDENFFMAHPIWFNQL